MNHIAPLHVSEAQTLIEVDICVFESTTVGSRRCGNEFFLPVMGTAVTPCPAHLLDGASCHPLRACVSGDGLGASGLGRFWSVDIVLPETNVARVSSLFDILAGSVHRG